MIFYAHRCSLVKLNIEKDTSMPPEWMNEKFWSTLHKNKSGEPINPFSEEPITPETVFIYSHVSAPLPSGLEAGEWYHFPSPQSASAFLKFTLLPINFSDWLVREEWDEDNSKFRSSDELLQLSDGSGKCRYADDIPLMRQLNTAITNAMENTSQNDALKLLKQTLNDFNARWSETNTWCFRLDLYENPSDVGEALLKQSTGRYGSLEDFEESHELSIAEWRNICATATNDPQNGDKLLNILAYSTVY